MSSNLVIIKRVALNRGRRTRRRDQKREPKKEIYRKGRRGVLMDRSRINKGNTKKTDQREEKRRRKGK